MQAIEVLMKTKKRIEKKVLLRVKDEAGSITYQGQDLTRHEEGITFLRTHQKEYFEAVDACIQNRVGQERQFPCCYNPGNTLLGPLSYSSLCSLSLECCVSIFLLPWRELVLISP